MKKLIIIFTFLFFLGSLNAAVEIKKFDNEQQEHRYKYIIDELRCLVCQNQNISGSNAGLAKDLRKQVHKMILAGEDDEAIFDFMVTRYGDFVLYRPPFKATTFLLWVGPFIIFVFGLFMLIRFIRQRKKVVVTELNSGDKEKLKQLLNEDKEQS
jgi:cytochrome c-type biogenesis protein CcmH